jgi:hypothetical protein
MSHDCKQMCLMVITELFIVILLLYHDFCRGGFQEIPDDARGSLWHVMLVKKVIVLPCILLCTTKVIVFVCLYIADRWLKKKRWFLNLFDLLIGKRIKKVYEMASYHWVCWKGVLDGVTLILLLDNIPNTKF